MFLSDIFNEAFQAQLSIGSRVGKLRLLAHPYQGARCMNDLICDRELLPISHCLFACFLNHGEIARKDNFAPSEALFELLPSPPGQIEDPTTYGLHPPWRGGIAPVYDTGYII